jgi:hypothetical protein
MVAGDPDEKARAMRGRPGYALPARPVGLAGAERAFRRLGWRTESAPEAIAAVFGHNPSRPTLAAWGHPRHPVASPLWVYVGPASLLAARCRFVWSWRPDAVAFVGLELDLRCWDQTTKALADAPSGAAIYLLGPSDLRRGIARRCALVEDLDAARPTRRLLVPPAAHQRGAPG